MVGWSVNIEQLVEFELARETKVLWENLGHCSAKWMTNHLSYGMA
jgi:hypothetical protein